MNFKHWLMLIGLFLFLLYGAHAQPQITVDPIHAVFEDTTSDKKIDVVFHIANSGNEPLHIINVSLECDSCMSYELSSREIDPNKTANLKITLNAHGLSGPITKELFIQSTDPDTPLIALNMSGIILPTKPSTLQIIPEKLTLNASDHKQQNIIFIRQHTDQPFVLRDVISSFSNIVCEIYPEPGLPNYRIYVYAHTMSQHAGEKGTLTILTEPANAEIKIPVTIDNTVNTTESN